jgi:polyphosphate kinase
MVANLRDETNSWELRPSGRYIRLTPADRRGAFSAHDYFMRNPSLSGRGRAQARETPPRLRRLSGAPE